MRCSLLVLTWLSLTACFAHGDVSPEVGADAPFAGFHRSAHFGEWVREGAFEPDARYLVNVAGDFDPERPTETVYYALPNGNTIEQTAGRMMTPGLDWHFDIQHIAAQTRALRRVMTDRNLVTVYLEAGGRSWPAWRREHGNPGSHLIRLLDEAFPLLDESTTRVLCAHSGGGSLITGILNASDEIPDTITRIAYLDANYSYDDDEGHGDKLLAWLRRDPAHALIAVCYDDRTITLNGRPVLSTPLAGTYGATQRMIARMRRDVDLAETREGDFLCFTGLDGRIDLRIHTNPENVILHTVLVGEMNGFIHALTLGTPHEGAAGRLEMGRAYSEWIQDGE